MKKMAIFLLAIVLSFLFPREVLAVENPLKNENNRVGVHILDPNEIDQVSDLVNANGGDWGYVTVPLRADDRNREKWGNFFAKARQHHLIPIIRLATVMANQGWAKPTLYDAVDFANFLNDFEWPTKNRYILVYNEPNHASEWGGEVNPEDYARILYYTAQIFKERNQDFYILPAGLDAAAPNDSSHLNLYTFLQRMAQAYPGVFQNIDGWTSHSYPNPAFSGRPTDTTSYSISGFRYETAYVKGLTGRVLPVFITETGWSEQALSDETLGAYYQTAFGQVWNQGDIVAVTPFLLLAGDGPFRNFSLLRPDGSPKPQYEAIKNLSKVAGRPESSPAKLAQVLGAQDSVNQKLPEVTPSLEPAWGKQNWHKFLHWLVLE